MHNEPDPDDIPEGERQTGTPIADKGVVSAPMRGTGLDAHESAGTPGESVIDAEYDDRGPPEHLDEHAQRGIVDTIEPAPYRDEEE